MPPSSSHDAIVAPAPAVFDTECARQRALGKKDAFSCQSILIALNLTLHRLPRMARLCRDLRHVHQLAQGSENFARWITQLRVSSAGLDCSTADRRRCQLLRPARI
jgi:hypothetical protein